MIMRDLYNWAKRLKSDNRGQDMIEYALLVGFVAVLIGAMFPQTIAPAVSTIFSEAQSTLTNAGS
jgi:Flp pilus assembly pilin Flp